MRASVHPWYSGRHPFSQAQRLQVCNIEWHVTADPTASLMGAAELAAAAVPDE